MIDGVIVTKLKIIDDERGNILHMLRNDSKVFKNFGECYFSEVNPGHIKAWKKHVKQTQNITVPIGEILVVFYDERANSISQNEFFSIKISRPKNYVMITIPPNVWYGFKCLSTNKALIVNCSDMPHEKEESISVNYKNGIIPYDWD
tara:strand:- start:431 stop:871 length:441 start_codon:yes stop_codon:yes gene_type:complete